MYRTPPIHADPNTAASPPTVSVVVPCYNYARFLPDAVESALAQESVDVNVVIVDDASTDNSLTVAESLAARDPRVQLVSHRVNQGHIATSNEALSLATGEFIVKLDADDLLTDGSLARSASLLQARPSAAFCYGWAETFRGDPPRLSPGNVRSWTVWTGSEWTKRVLRRGHNVIRQPEIMLRRSAVDMAGGYRAELLRAQDFNLWLRLAAVGDVGRVDGPTQGLYRVHGGSLMHATDDFECTNFQWQVAAIEMYVDELERDADQVGDLRGLALSSLSREAKALAARVAERPDRAAERKMLTLAADLDRRSGVPPVRSLAASRTMIGRPYRDLAGRVRWRRWRRSGL